MKKELVKFYITYKLFIFPAIVALSCLILIGFVIYPQVSQLLSNQKAQGEFIRRSEILEAKAQDLEKFDARDLDLKVNYALGAFPTDKDFATVVGLLQSITSKSGFNINSLSLGAGAGKAQNAQVYTIKLDLIGPKLLLPALINNIESSPRLMRVGSLDTTVGRDAQSSAVSLDLEVLYAPLPNEFGTLDSPLPELTEKDDELLSRIARTGEVVSVVQPGTVQLGPRGKPNPFE